MTSTKFGRLSHIIIFGKGWAAAENLQLANGHSVLGHLRSCGKVVLNLPHPSGQNGEYVALASLSPSEFPTQEALRLH